ncbi:MAG TPA: sigma-70 family RNA polymerase sigma factor [Solirubrobacteraceae bacterium]|nr:sigma-70 family RNA polymerase sigma factor [Solirubrobacteraceae bacterium]
MDRTDERQLPPAPAPQSTPVAGGSGWGPGQTPSSAAGESDTFRALVETHRPELLRYARRQLGGRAELAEDVLQDAFLNAYRHLAAGTRPQNTRAWLYAIVHNAATNVARATQPPVSLEANHYSIAGGPTPSEAIEQREWLEWLMGAIGALPARQRDALVGHALEGRSYRELATREQTTVSAIKTLIHRARRGLAEGSPLHALAVPFLLISRRLTGFTVHRALAGKLSANGITGMLLAALGTATLTSGLLLAGQAGHSVAIAASRRQAVSAHASAHRRTRGGGTRAPNIGRSPAGRLHHEARLATAECENGRHLNRRLRVVALQYAASHLTTMQMEYTDCEQILRMRVRRIASARGHRHAPPGHRGKHREHGEHDRHAA